MPCFSSGTSSSVMEKNSRYDVGISNASHILFIVSLVGNDAFFSMLQSAFAEIPHLLARSFCVIFFRVLMDLIALPMSMEKSRARDPLQRLSADPSRHKKESHKSRYKTDPCQSYSDRGFFS